MTSTETLNQQLVPATANRVPRSLALRTETTGADSFTASPAQIDNGDEARYADKSGTYTKGILQEGIGLVDLAAYDSFKQALSSGDPADFEKIVLGGPRTLNGPQGGLAFYLECADASQFAVPPAPALASEEYATELIELYWASLLRDIAFTDYTSNSDAKKAAAELSSKPTPCGATRPCWQRDPGPAVPRRLCGRRGRPVCVAVPAAAHGVWLVTDRAAVLHQQGRH